MSSWIERLRSFPEGACEGRYRGRRWLMRKQTLQNGRLIKFYAEELGGNDFVSLNVYRTGAGVLLKPCEMAERKVTDFIGEAELL